mgnify:CR=1 FL=1
MKMPVKDRKVQLLVWISEDVDRKLRELIQQKYKEFQKGILSAEVEVAIRNHIAAHLNDKNKFEVKHLFRGGMLYCKLQIELGEFGLES